MANIIKIDNAIAKRKKKNKKKIAKEISCRFLIICEGEKTEPNYFKKFKAIDNGSFVVNIEVNGLGSNTIAVVDKAISMKKSAITPFDSVWAVFDRDSFPERKFNGAIITARENGINVAWSNEAFELWYLLHFKDRITAMGRGEYKNDISNAVNSSSLWKGRTRYKYAKNDENNYSIMKKYGSQEEAIRRAEKQHKTFVDKKYATHNPCTTIYELVKQLLGKDQSLIDEVMKKHNSAE